MGAMDSFVGFVLENEMLSVRRSVFFILHSLNLIACKNEHVQNQGGEKLRLFVCQYHYKLCPLILW